MRLRVLLTVAALAASAPVLLSAQAIGTVEHDLEYGRDYMKAGNPSSAATYFRQAVMKFPDHAEANLLLAVALQRSGKAGEARLYFDKAIGLDPGLAARPEVQAVAAALNGPAIAAAPTVTVPKSVNDPDAPIGSAAYLLNYARDFLREGNFEAAADYARQALGVEPGNAAAQQILADAKGRRAPADASAAVRGPGGDPNRVGSPAYLLKYAKYHMGNKDYDSAVVYAKRALAIDPGFSDARALLTLASRQAATAPKKARNSCEARFSTCWSSATTYTPGSGFSADNLRRQQCFVERNICQGSK